MNLLKRMVEGRILPSDLVFAAPYRRWTLLEVEEQHVSGLTVREAVLEKARLAIQVGEGVAEHGVETPPPTFGGRVADLGVLCKVVEIAMDQKRVDGRLLAERVDRVLVRCRQKWLTDVEEQQLNGVAPSRDKASARIAKSGTLPSISPTQ